MNQGSVSAWTSQLTERVIYIFFSANEIFKKIILLILILSVSMDSNGSQHFIDQKTADKDKKSKSLRHKNFIMMSIILRSLIILALIFLIYFGLYLVLNNMTSPVQTVTVSSEGPAAELYPDSMGQYNLLRDVFRYDRAVYKHVDRENRFIIYTGRSLRLK